MKRVPQAFNVCGGCGREFDSAFRLEKHQVNPYNSMWCRPSAIDDKVDEKEVYDRRYR